MIISNIQTVVSINSRKLLSSGVVHVEGELPIKIQIANLRFAFKFAKDDGESRYSGEVSGDELLFTLYNHGNSLGEGFFRQYPLQLLKGKICLSLTSLIPWMPKKDLVDLNMLFI